MEDYKKKNDDTFSYVCLSLSQVEVARAKSSNEINANLLPADMRATQ